MACAPHARRPTVAAHMLAHRAGIFALAYALLLIYASLHPLQGWQSTARSFWDMLLAPWPRYWTGFDVAANVLAYLPLGWLSYLALRTQRAAPWHAILLAVLLSLSMEGVQGFLASRVASNLDVLANTLGAALGIGLASIMVSRACARGADMPAGPPASACAAASAAAPAPLAWAQVLLLCGLLAQAAPVVPWLQFGDVTLLPGAAELRASLAATMLSLLPSLAASASAAGMLGAVHVAANVVLLGLVYQACSLPGVRRGLPGLMGVLLLGLLARVSLYGLQLGWTGGLEALLKATLVMWNFAGALLGLCFYVWSRRWSARSCWFLSLGLVLVIALLVPLQSFVPELAQSSHMAVVKPVAARHLQNFTGLLQFVAALWSYLVLLWMMRYRSWWQLRARLGS